MNLESHASTDRHIHSNELRTVTKVGPLLFTTNLRDSAHHAVQLYSALIQQDPSDPSGHQWVVVWKRKANSRDLLLTTSPSSSFDCPCVTSSWGPAQSKRGRESRYMHHVPTMYQALTLTDLQPPKTRCIEIKTIWGKRGHLKHEKST